MRDRFVARAAAGAPAGGLSRRGFLSKVGVGGAGLLAATAVGDLLFSPVAGASTGPHRGRMTRYDTPPPVEPDGCVAYATCRHCQDCCPGGPCPPGQYCFYCTATPCQGAGVACYPSTDGATFYICCG